MIFDSEGNDITDAIESPKKNKPKVFDTKDVPLYEGEGEGAEDGGFLSDVGDTVMGAVGAFNEPFLEGLSTLEHTLTGNGNWVDPHLMDARALQKDGNWAGNAVGSLGGSSVMAVKLASGLQKLPQMAGIGEKAALVMGDFLSELLQTDGDKVGDQSILSKGDSAATSAGLTMGAGKLMDMAGGKEGAMKAAELYVPPSSQKLIDEGVPLTSRTIRNDPVLVENMPNTVIDAAGREGRRIANVVEGARSYLGSKGARVQNMNAKPESSVRDGNVLVEFNQRAFDKAIPDIDGAAAAVGKFDGATGTFNRLKDVYEKGYKAVFDGEEISDITMDTFKAGYKTLKKSIKGKALKKDDKEIANEFLDTMKTIGKGGDDNLENAYKIMKEGIRKVGNSDLKTAMQHRLDDLIADFSDDAHAQLRKLDKTYPEYLSLSKASNAAKDTDLITHGNLKSGSSAVDSKHGDDIFGDMLRDWSSAISGVNPRVAFGDLEPMSKEFGSELLHRGKEFTKAITKKPKFDLDKYMSEGAQKRVKQGATGVNNVFED